MRKNVSKKILCGALPFSLVLMNGCGSSDSTSDTVSASKPSSVISGVNQGVVGTGNQMGQTAAGGNSIAKALQFNPMDLLIPKALASGGGVDSVCDEHGTPLNLNQSSADYPALLFFCKLAKNTGSPDSVQGSYTMVKSISCMLEKAGLTFDGQAHSMTATPDSTCFTASQLQDMGTSSMTISVTASKPAAFNSYFDAGIVMNVPNFGSFTVGAKVSGSKLEFIAREDQTAVSAGKTGVYAASYDSSTGDLRFEARHDRFACTESGSCGWSRHDRIYAKLALSGSDIVGLTSISGIASEIYKNGSNYNAAVSSIKGDLSTGLKARLWQVGTTTTSADLASASNYTEVSNSKCYTKSSSSADCSSNSGIALAGSGLVPFTLHPSSGATSTASWLSSYAGMTFTSVNFSDVQ